MFTKVGQNVAASVFALKVKLFKIIVQNVAKYLANFLEQISWQDL